MENVTVRRGRYPGRMGFSTDPPGLTGGEGCAMVCYVEYTGRRSYGRAKCKTDEVGQLRRLRRKGGCRCLGPAFGGAQSASGSEAAGGL